MATFLDDLNSDNSDNPEETEVLAPQDVPGSWDASDNEEKKASWDDSSDSEEEAVKEVPKVEEKPEVKVEEVKKVVPKVEEKPKVTANVEPQAEEGEHLRSPICVIMGHVDTGKTKLLDKIRRSNIQEGEAGGITQQIGATYFPKETLRRLTTFFADKFKLEYLLPGLLIIDTPGHESFSNLRSRGSSLCDIAILVVDIMHGIEKQTRESIGLLRAKKTPFVVALNKVDRISDWKANPGAAFVDSIRKQSQHCKDQFKKNLASALTQFQEEGLNAKPYYEMKFGDNVRVSEIPVIPTSAITGEGIPDLLAIVHLLTQTKMQKKLTSKNELQCTVLEVKVEQGIGTTLDVILVNGVLRVNDTIVVAGLNGPISTHIRALLTPEPMKELRVKSQWVHHEVIYAAMGCKIAAPGLEGAIAGSELFVASNPDEVEELKSKVVADVESILGKVDKTQDGLLVQASTLGSLEALLSFLESKEIPVCSVGIGPLYRRDLLPIQQIAQRNPKFAVALAFNVEISQEAQRYAQENDIKIFNAEIIYHLTDMYDSYLKDLKAKMKEAARASAIFPVSIQYLENQLIHRSKPVIIGVRVLEGTLRKGTPITTVGDHPRFIGTVDSIQVNKQSIDTANVNQECAVSIKPPNDWNPVADEDFHPKDIFVTRMNRPSIDLLKEHFRDDLKKEDWELIVKIKRLLKIT